jgi:hypothetical protein
LEEVRVRAMESQKRKEEGGLGGREGLKTLFEELVHLPVLSPL